jgi:putative transposase
MKAHTITGNVLGATEDERRDLDSVRVRRQLTVNVDVALWVPDIRSWALARHDVLRSSDVVYRILYRFFATLARLAVRSGRSKDPEIIVLRHQLMVLDRQDTRPDLDNHDRSLLGAIAAAFPRPRRAGWLVTPDTLLRWHRQRIVRHWTRPTRRPGRPSTLVEIRRLMIDMATDNPTWGYRRNSGELDSLGHCVGASTVWRILKRHGINPAPQRSSVTWTQLLRSQAAVACDFATIDTAFLRRYHLLFFIDVTTREVFFAGITTNPTGAWTTQAARNLFLRHRDRLTDSRALVRDRGSQFIDAFDDVFAAEGLKILKTPIRTQVANTFAERWIGTLRRELLDRTIIWNQHQLERLVIDYIEHYNTHRPHRSLHQRPPAPQHPLTAESQQPPHVIRSSRCDGLINEYRHAA